MNEDVGFGVSGQLGSSVVVVLVYVDDGCPDASVVSQYPQVPVPVVLELVVPPAV